MVHSKILLHLTRNDDIDASVKTVPFLSFTWVLIGPSFLCIRHKCNFDCMQPVLMANCNVLAVSTISHLDIELDDTCTILSFDPNDLPNDFLRYSYSTGNYTTSIGNKDKTQFLSLTLPDNPYFDPWLLPWKLAQNLKIIYQANILGISSSLLHF